jgi:hypothetical protein
LGAGTALRGRATPFHINSGSDDLILQNSFKTFEKRFEASYINRLRFSEDMIETPKRLPRHPFLCPNFKGCWPVYANA